MKKAFRAAIYHCLADPGEIGDANAAGFTAVSLGPRVLRTESAAIAALAVLQSLWGDLG